MLTYHWRMVDIPFRHGTLDTPLRRARMVAPGKEALVDGDHRFTYAELADRVDRLRGGLLGLGLDPGDRVAGLGLNSFRHFEAWFAIPTSNLVFNDLNFRLAQPELEFIVNDSGAPLAYLSVSTMLPAEVCEYPDSGKIGAFGGGLRHMTRAGDHLDYWTDEA